MIERIRNDDAAHSGGPWEELTRLPITGVVITQTFLPVSKGNRPSPSSIPAPPHFFAAARNSFSLREKVARKAE